MERAPELKKPKGMPWSEHEQLIARNDRREAAREAIEDFPPELQEALVRFWESASGMSWEYEEHFDEF